MPELSKIIGLLLVALAVALITRRTRRPYTVALALGLPLTLAGRDNLIAIVFGIVLFSLLGQGLTLPPLLRCLGLVRQERDA